MPKYTPTEAEVARITNLFTYHPPKEDQPERYVEIREKALELGLLMSSDCPPSRELSLALTYLQLAVNLANGSIAVNE
jgi:hypothetical protein